MPFYFIIFLTLLFQIALKGNILLVSLYALHLHASLSFLGVIIAAGSLFPMFLASIAGRLSDRMSLNLLLMVGMTGSGISLIAIYFSAESLWVLLCIQLLFGLFQIITVVSSQNLVGVLSNEETRTKNYGAYTLSVSIANFIGPLLVGFVIDSVDYAVAYFMLGIFAFVPGVLFLFIPIKSAMQERKARETNANFLQLLMHKNLRTVFITSGIILTAVGLFEFYFPIYANTIGLSPSVIGMLVGANALAFIISRLLMNRLQRKYAPVQILGSCLLIAGGGFFLLPFFSSIPMLGLISFVMGLGLGCCQPLSIVMAYNASPSGHTGEVLGIRLTVNKAVQFAVPIVFGSISFVGFFPIFWMNSILLVCSSGSLLQWLRRTP
ncbi:MFS transporter [Solibacillus silvestris]|uniref:MFS transporter n=1 Tax=Solibacillus silvestris TaxID=76853 RepID=UPI003F7DD51B